MKTFIKSIFIVILTAGLINMQAGSSVSRYINFYGHILNVNHDHNLTTFTLSNLSQDDISSKLSAFRNSNLSRSTNTLSQHIKKYQFDDLATVILTDKYASQLRDENNSNEITFIKYLLLRDLGYDVILIKTGNILNCLGRLGFTPGRYVYIKYNNKTYKDLDFKNRVNKGKHLIYKDLTRTSLGINHSPNHTPRISAHLSQKNYHLPLT